MPQSIKQKALLKNKLQMPLIVRDMLVTNQSPADDANYALHEMMSDFQPDESILCSAFVMQEMASIRNIDPSDLKLLNMECERLIERYSARDELSKENPQLWEDSQSEMMSVIAEDIEGFLELISSCNMAFKITSPKTAALLSIIITQLKAQLMIIGEVIYMMETAKCDTKFSNMPFNDHVTDNVIMFPA